MRKQNRIILLALTICSLSGISVWLISNLTVKGQSQEGSASETSLTLLDKINQKARGVKKAKETKNNEADIKVVDKSVNELAEAVLGSFGLNSEQLKRSNTMAAIIIGPDIEEMKGRLIRSEIEYQNGRKAGTPEEKVVNVVNSLAESIKAPKYAKTDKYEVRRLRTWMLGYMPEFVSREHPVEEDNIKNKKEKSLVSPLMSPLEAAYVTALLINQKRTNEEYQLTSEERRARWAEKDAQKSAENKDDRPRPAPQTERQVEMSKVISDALSAMSLTEQRELGHKMLDVLGIDP